MECRRCYLGKEIIANIDRLDYGIIIHVSGGDLSHIGAVSIVDENGETQTTYFPGHKDQFISELWAKKIYSISRAPVVVVAGIHYDEVSKEEIKGICECAEELLEQVCGLLEETL